MFIGFAVSAGSLSALCEAAERQAMPYLPGVFTPSEIMAAREAGYSRLKFFPSEAAGGSGHCDCDCGVLPDYRTAVRVASDWNARSRERDRNAGRPRRSHARRTTTFPGAPGADAGDLAGAAWVRRAVSACHARR